MSLPTILCVLIALLKLFWFPKYVTGSFTPCPVVTTEPECPDGYIETPSPRACVKYYENGTIVFEKAVEYCKNVDPPYSSLWISYNSKMTNQLGEVMALIAKQYGGRRATAWIGLKRMKSGTWGWVNGQQLRNGSERWRQGEPRGGVKQCTFALSDGSWVTGHCGNRRNVVCMRRHQIGPREIDMSVKYHAPERAPNVIYRGIGIKFTCSAFAPRDTYDFITIREKSMKSSKPFHYKPPAFRTVRNSLGKCAHRASIEISYISYREISSGHLTFDCFTRKLDTYDKNTHCQNEPNEFCRTFSFPVVMLDPPYEKPMLNINMTRDKQVNIDCAVDVGAIGKLTFVLYFKNRTQVLEDDDQYIVHKSRGQGSSYVRWFESMALLVDYEVVKGIDIGCFDHNVTKYNLSLMCEPDDLFCDIKNVGIVDDLKDDDQSDVKELGNLKFSMVFVVLGWGVIIMILYFAQPRDSFIVEEDNGDSPSIESDEKTQSKSNVVDKEQMTATVVEDQVQSETTVEIISTSQKERIANQEITSSNVNLVKEALVSSKTSIHSTNTVRKSIYNVLRKTFDKTE